MMECGVGVFPATPFEVAVDEETMRAIEPLPECPRSAAISLGRKGEPGKLFPMTGHYHHYHFLSRLLLEIARK